MTGIVKGVAYPIRPIALGLERFQTRSNVHGSTEHAKWEKDLLAEKVCIAFPRKSRNDFTQQSISQVGVLEALARSSDQIAIAPNGLTHRRGLVRLILIEKLVV